MASQKNREALLLKQKEAKQKKLLLALVPVLLLLLAWQGPKMYKAFTGGSEAQADPAPAATTPTDPSSAPSPSPAQSQTGAQAPAPAGMLSDTEVPPEAEADQLISFSRFTGRDPFVQLDGASASSSGSGGDDGGSGGSSDDSGSEAVIEINGKQEQVSVGEAFPATDPTFTLDSLSGDAAVIGLVQGMFEDGSSTVEIALGERVVLVAAPDSTRYTIELLSIS